MRKFACVLAAGRCWFAWSRFRGVGNVSTVSVLAGRRYGWSAASCVVGGSRPDGEQLGAASACPCWHAPSAAIRSLTWSMGRPAAESRFPRRGGGRPRARATGYGAVGRDGGGGGGGVHFISSGKFITTLSRMPLVLSPPSPENTVIIFYRFRTGKFVP